jgi:hypothetical protein
MTRHAPACFINELYYNNAVCLHSHFLQEFVMAQLPSANVDDVELRKKFGAMISSAILSDTSAAGSNAGGLRMDKSGNTELRGSFRCTRLTVNAKWWPDAVFADNYRLMPLSEVASFIKTNRHLPGIPSEKAVLENGQDVGALQVLQQQKIEELTLYAIEQDKKLKEQEIAIAEQKKQMAAQEDRLQKLEKLLNQK